MQYNIAYFSMEIALDPTLPSYSGGLGVLAGDTLRAAADLRAPMSAVTLLHRKGYFRQHLDKLGNQSGSPEVWHPEEMLETLGASRQRRNRRAPRARPRLAVRCARRLRVDRSGLSPGH